VGEQCGRDFVWEANGDEAPAANKVSKIQYYFQGRDLKNFWGIMAEPAQEVDLPVNTPYII
jgi:hypothetical protein